MLYLVALLSMLLLGVEATSYEVEVDYTCTEPADPNLPCRKWKQTGTLTQNVQCFSGDALVLTKFGVKRMDELKVGDFVLGYNEAAGKDDYTEVRAWLHRIPEISADYVQFKTANGTMASTPYHNIATVDDTLEYSFAKDLKVGQTLMTTSGPEQILEVSKAVAKKGMYAPHTMMSNYYVGQTAESLYLAHAFAHVTNPRSYEWGLNFAMSCGELFSSDLHQITNTNENYFHPVARSLRSVFPFLVTEPPTKRQLRSNDNNDDTIEFISIMISKANTILFDYAGAAKAMAGAAGVAGLTTAAGTTSFSDADGN